MALSLTGSAQRTKAMDEELLIVLLKGAFLNGLLCGDIDGWELEFDEYIERKRYENPGLFKN